MVILLNNSSKFIDKQFHTKTIQSALHQFHIQIQILKKKIGTKTKTNTHIHTVTDIRNGIANENSKEKRNEKLTEFAKQMTLLLLLERASMNINRISEENVFMFRAKM